MPMAAFVIVVAGIKLAQPILVPLLVAAFLAVIAVPPLSWLQRRGVATGVALLIVVVVVAGVGLFLTAVVGASLNDFMASLPEYQQRVSGLRDETIRWLAEKGFDVGQGVDQDGLSPRKGMQIVAQLVGGLGTVFRNAFLILLTLMFILLEAAGLPTKIAAMPGTDQARLDRLEQILKDLRHYVAIKTWISLATGGLLATWLHLLGVKYPLMWGLLAFLCNYVPNIGSIIAALPPISLALLQLGAFPALYVAIGFVAVNVGIGNLIEPRVMGQGLGLSTLVVFLSLVFWGWVLGPVGMLLSVPLTMIAKIILDGNEQTRGLAILLSSESAVRAQTIGTTIAVATSDHVPPQPPKM